MIAICCFVFGLVIGYLYRGVQPQKQKSAVQKSRNVYLSYSERQRQKIRNYNDAERIRQLNLLSPNESKFMRLLQHEFEHSILVVKDKRFYIADQDHYPIAIFEYRDGTQRLKVEDQEEGTPVFLYKAILSKDDILKDKLKLEAEGRLGRFNTRL